MQCIVDGLVVGYDVLGKGKTIVMLHGWGASRQSLSALAKELSKKYQVVLVDVPGFGESAKPTKSWGLSEYAEWVQSFLQKIKIKNVYALLGHSNGGAIAIKLTSLGFQSEKLILLGAAGIRKRNRGRKLLFKAVAKTGKAATIVLPKKVKKAIRNKWYKTIGSELYHAPGMEATFKKIASEDMQLEAAMISTPTLLIYGAEDEATPPLFGRIYHEAIEGSELDIVEGAGHYSFVDRPEVVFARVRAFLG